MHLHWIVTDSSPSEPDCLVATPLAQVATYGFENSQGDWLDPSGLAELVEEAAGSGGSQESFGGKTRKVKAKKPARQSKYEGWPEYFGGKKVPKRIVGGKYQTDAQKAKFEIQGGGGEVYDIDEGRHWPAVKIVEELDNGNEFKLEWGPCWLNKREYEIWVGDVEKAIMENDYGDEWFCFIKNTWTAKDDVSDFLKGVWEEEKKARAAGAAASGGGSASGGNAVASGSGG
ncbi:hypothetical protein P7C70_g8563, partial [Phenoliferia sp. Uapishka_3]